MSNCALLISTHCFWPLGIYALMPTATNHTHILHINERFRHVLLMTALDRKTGISHYVQMSVRRETEPHNPCDLAA